MKKIQIIWYGIHVDVSYEANYLKSRTRNGSELAHINVYCDQKLPITSTGYRSIFLSAMEVKNYDGVDKLVESLLNENAKTKEWLEYEKSQQ